MSLVGVIEAGAVDRILQSVTFASADALVLFSRDDVSGHVLFENGKIVTARLGDLRDDQAIAALKEWSAGHYTLIKRGHVAEGIRGHVALGIPGTRARRAIARWLKHHDYQTSVIADPKQAIETMEYLQPDLLIVECPRHSFGVTCGELSMRLRQEMRLAPAIMVLHDPAHACPEPSPPCIRGIASVDGVKRMLALDWSGTRLGVRQASMDQTAKIPPPRLEPRQGTTQKPASEEKLALAIKSTLHQGRLTFGDLLLALAVSLVGSAAIWLAWWWAFVRR